MVHISEYLLKSYSKVAKKSARGNTFLDTLRLTVRGGHGGNGLPKYGGIGGQGGCVHLIAKNNVTLRQLCQRYKDKRIVACHGGDSSKIRVLGQRGADVCVEVPTGVVVFDDQKNLLGDLNSEQSYCIVAGGGMGGCTGNNFLGRPGEHRTINLDLKLIADIGLVGFPNAGKSTFLKAISRANPKIASYPFTTIRPQIGTVVYRDLRSITIADLPGLIEGAHANFGMGHKFLKHVERTRLLLFIVDIFGFRLSPKHLRRSCLENIYALNKELELYDSSLLSKPCVLLINKMDLDGAVDQLNVLKQQLRNLDCHLNECPEEIRPEHLLKFEKILPISALNNARINEVKEELRNILDELAAKELHSENEINELLKHQLGEKGPRVT